MAAIVQLLRLQRPSSKAEEETKRLKFSSAHLKRLSAQTEFSPKEVTQLYQAFRSLVGNRKPLEGGLSLPQLLQLFGLSYAAPFGFSRNFAALFWQRRDEGRGMEIGFEEFVRTLSVWIRGTARERLLLFFRMLDQDAKGYVSKEDIQELCRSLLSLALLAKPSDFDCTSPEFKARILLQRMPLEDVTRECAIIAERIAENAIRNFHCGNDEAEILWANEFCQWYATLPGVEEALCAPSGVQQWLESIRRTASSNL